jgi:hypothetical protein
VAQEVVGAIYEALKTFVTWLWEWVASAISWFINAVAQYIYNLFISFINTLGAVVSAVAGWLWGAVKTMVIAPAQSALTNAVAFIQRKLFGTIYIAALVKLYEIEIKSFVEKPSLKKVLLMIAKPLLLYIGLSIMFGTLQGMGLMPAVQPGPLVAPTAPAPTPVAGVPTLPTAPTGIEVREVLRFSGTAKGAAALVQALADAVRFSGTAAGVAPQVPPVPSDAVRTSLAVTYTTGVRPTLAQDVVRASLYAGAARPVTVAPRDVLRSALAARGVVLPTARPSDTVYSALRASWTALPTTKVGDVVRPMYGVEWERVTLASAGDVIRSSLKVIGASGTTVLLFNTGDWNTAKLYVDDYSIIICTYGIATLSADEVRQLVASKKVVFVIEVDTEPYYPLEAPAWYNVFYTVQAPRSCGMDIGNVTDPDFQQFLGSSVPCLFDYNVDLSYKVSGTRNWAGDSCGWGYKRYEQGAIIEVPCDGLWKDADWLGRYVDAISSILLGVSRPARILYLGHYGTDYTAWHDCSTIDNCWKALAQARGWSVVDLRG